MSIPNNIQRQIVVLDNNGETFDRYTIIDRKTSDVYGSSSNPFHPQGFGGYSHNICQSRGMKNDSERFNRICVNLYLKDSKNIGIRVKDLDTLPTDVQKYIIQISKE